MFAAIEVPDFALQAVLRAEPELRERALAIVDDQLPARVRQMTPPARARGVEAGMTTTQALGRCPGMLFRTPGEGVLAAPGACLLQCAETFSPWLEATSEGVVTIELRLSDRIAQSRGAMDDEALCGFTPFRLAFTQIGHKIVERLAQLGLRGRVGVAANPDLALLAAQRAEPVRVVENARDFLTELPIEMVAPPARMQPILRKWGVRTLGTLAALSRDQLVTRLGPDAGNMWDRAAGQAQRLLTLIRAPETFIEAHEFEQEVETLEPLLFVLRRFCEQLSARLEASYRVAAVLHLRLRFAGQESKVEGREPESDARSAQTPALDPPRRQRGQEEDREWASRLSTFDHSLKIPAPTREVDVLFRILDTYLEGLTAPAPIIAVELSADPMREEQKQFRLFETGLRDPNKFFETLARLQALLGHARAGTPALEDTHRPDAFRVETPRFDAEERPRGNSSAAQTSTFDLRPSTLPLRRFRPPLQAQVHVEAGRPVAVFSDKAFGPVRESRGPWKCSGEWWDERSWAREEWDVQVAGALYRLAHEHGSWFLEGAYD